MRITLFLAFMTACAADPSTATDQQGLGKNCSDGVEPARCDGMSWSDGDQYCNFVCIIDGDVGGFCWHTNPNDAYHGLCVGGFPPLRPNPTGGAL